MDDFANQLAMSLWMGLAYANSGINAVTGTGVAGSGGSVGAGDGHCDRQRLADRHRPAVRRSSGRARRRPTSRSGRR